jgi:hypothetical protein
MRYETADEHFRSDKETLGRQANVQLLRIKKGLVRCETPGMKNEQPWTSADAA